MDKVNFIQANTKELNVVEKNEKKKFNFVI